VMFTLHKILLAATHITYKKHMVLCWQQILIQEVTNCTPVDLLVRIKWKSQKELQTTACSILGDYVTMLSVDTIHGLKWYNNQWKINSSVALSWHFPGGNE
jgi:hypothetical protein